MSEKIESRSRIVGGVEPLCRQDELLDSVTDRVHVHVLFKYHQSFNLKFCFNFLSKTLVKSVVLTKCLWNFGKFQKMCQAAVTRARVGTLQRLLGGQVLMIREFNWGKLGWLCKVSLVYLAIKNMFDHKINRFFYSLLNLTS